MTETGPGTNVVNSSRRQHLHQRLGQPVLPEAERRERRRGGDRGAARHAADRFAAAPAAQLGARPERRLRHQLPRSVAVDSHRAAARPSPRRTRSWRSPTPAAAGRRAWSTAPVRPDRPSDAGPAQSAPPTTAAGGSTYGETAVFVRKDATHYAYFFIAGGSLTAWVNKGSGEVNLTTGWPAYSSANMQWLRFRESGGTLYWEYSSSGNGPLDGPGSERQPVHDERRAAPDQRRLERERHRHGAVRQRRRRTRAGYSSSTSVCQVGRRGLS